MSKFVKSIGLPLVGALAIFGSSQAMAAATIINPAGTVAIGVDNLGQLGTGVGGVAINTGGTTGVAYKFPDGFRDATAPGCVCEGWGVSVNGTTAGYANNSAGTANLTQTAFSSTATTASVTTALTSLTGLTVTHSFVPATNASTTLYRAHVTISNTTGAAVNNVKYVRVMDWDVPPTEFSEIVTIKGTGSTTLLEKSHRNGFDTANPLGSPCDATGCGYGGVDADFTDAGPADHGAYFRFNFGTIEDGAVYEFDIFYGAAASEREALAAIGSEGIELYSLGQANPSSDSLITFIFGFKGVGGKPIEPDPNETPEPGTLALLGLACAGLWSSRRRVAK